MACGEPERKELCRRQIEAELVAKAEYAFIKRYPDSQDRTRARWTGFYYLAIKANNRVPILATTTPGGTCLICGEDGRCPGWHIDP